MQYPQGGGQRFLVRRLYEEAIDLPEKTNKLKGKRLKKARAVKQPKEASLTRMFRTFYEIMVAEGRSKRTLGQYEDNFGYFYSYVTKRLTDPSMDEITVDVIRAYITYMREEIVRFEGHKFKRPEEQTVGLAFSTINTRLKTLRVFFKTMYAEGYIDHNPMENVKNLREEEKHTVILDEDEILALLSVPDQRYFQEFRDYVLIYFLLDSLTRISEATGLVRNDFDFKANSVTVPASLAKNRKARTLYLQERTMTLIKELIAENKADFDDEHVFLSNYGAPLEAGNVRDRLKSYARRAAIKKRIHPHLLRHTGATMFLMNGGDIRHLQMILGHSDMRMVQRYTHLTDQFMRKSQTIHSPMHAVTNKLYKKRKSKRR